MVKISQPKANLFEEKNYGRGVGSFRESKGGQTELWSYPKHYPLVSSPLKSISNWSIMSF